MPRVVLASIGVLLLALSLTSLRAQTDDELALTVHVTSADHELIEGYFSLGQTTSVVAKPDTPLYNWLRGHVGQRVRLTVQVPPTDSREP